MKRELKTSADVKSIINILLNQVLEKENYDLKVEAEVHFDECEPTEDGYIMGNATFLPWGADAFNVMQEFLENTVSADYISVELNIHNLQEPVEEATRFKREITEEIVREHFNLTFSALDDSRSAGAFYVGDNGAYMCDYMDITKEEAEMILVNWAEAFTSDAFIAHEYRGNCMMIHIS